MTVIRSVYVSFTILILALSLPWSIYAQSNDRLFLPYGFSIATPDSGWHEMPILPERSKYDLLWMENEDRSKSLIVSVMDMPRTMDIHDPDFITSYKKGVEGEGIKFITGAYTTMNSIPAYGLSYKIQQGDNASRAYSTTITANGHAYGVTCLSKTSTVPELDSEFQAILGSFSFVTPPEYHTATGAHSSGTPEFFGKLAAWILIGYMAIKGTRWYIERKKRESGML